MKIEYRVIEIDDKLGFVETGKTLVEETPVEGRHHIICNICGYPDYPECTSWCHNEKARLWQEEHGRFQEPFSEP